MAIARDTVHDLLAHLEDCFLVRTVWMESHSERQRMVNPRKAYPADPGLIPCFDRSGRSNLGHALEGGMELIQVCADASDPAVAPPGLSVQPAYEWVLARNAP